MRLHCCNGHGINDRRLISFLTLAVLDLDLKSPDLRPTLNDLIGGAAMAEDQFPDLSVAPIRTIS